MCMRVWVCVCVSEDVAVLFVGTRVGLTEAVGAAEEAADHIALAFLFEADRVRRGRKRRERGCKRQAFVECAYSQHGPH